MLRADSLAFAFEGVAPLFTSLDFTLPPGWTGLAGPNGSGKSTLLDLLQATRRPSGGVIHRAKGARVVRCPQRTLEPTPEVRALEGRDDGDAWSLKGRLGLVAPPEPWSAASHGERQRWVVAGALAADADVLLLDEPTNHLDAESRQWLLDALRRFKGVGVLVSHDRAFLDALTTRTLWLERGTVRTHPGPVSAALAAFEAESLAERTARDEAKAELRRLERSLHQARQRQAQTEAARSTKHRMRDPNDSDARTLGAANLADWANAKAGRGTTTLSTRVEAKAQALAATGFEKKKGGEVRVPGALGPSAWLCFLEAGPLAVGHRTLELPALGLARGQRLALQGPNGAGKSTLLDALVAQRRVAPERLLVLPQELPEHAGRTLVESTLALEPRARGRVFALLATLGVDPEVVKQSRAPSPGETRQLWLAHGLSRDEVWGVVLDEPSNHLDLPAIARLERALQRFPGALLLVSHDEVLARATTSERWVLSAEGGFARAAW